MKNASFKISQVFLALFILFLIAGVYVWICRWVDKIKSSVVAREEGMILEYHTNVVARNSQRIHINSYGYGDLAAIKAGDVILKIGEVNDDYIVMYYPRGYSIGDRYDGLVFLWNKKEYDETIERQRSIRLAVSNALAKTNAMVK